MHTKKENGCVCFSTWIKVQQQRAEGGREEKDGARLQMMFRLSEPPLPPVTWTGVKLVT